MYAAQTAVYASWLIATAGHFLLTTVVIHRWFGAELDSADARLFASVIAGVGTLSVVLHLTTVTTGLGFGSGLATLVLWHSVMLVATYKWAPKAPRGETIRLTFPELVSMTVVAAIVFGWIDAASASASISGADAAHYHVPFAINIALGSHLFDPPATQHVYPLAGSVIAAWFIVPSGIPLLVDLGMCLAFMVMLVSLNLLFRLTTGASGLAWNTWFVLLLFSTPLFRQSSLPSADLWFAAGFVAFLASMVASWHRACWTVEQTLLAALALGLLLGSKSTGTLAAVLLLTFTATTILIHRWRSHGTRILPGWHVLLAAVVLALGSGGIWLLRGWLMYGSPIAPAGLTVLGYPLFDGEPFSPTTYLSVLGDLEADEGYDVVQRATRYSRLWLGKWWLISLPLMALVPIQLMISWRLRRGGRHHASRALLAVATALSTCVLLATLIGAPWTSLEWTRGFSLRYALPLAALLPFLAFVGFFPPRWRWYEHRDASVVAFILLAAFCGAAFVTSPMALRSAPVPPVIWIWLPAGILVAGLAHVLASRSARVRRTVVTIAMVGAALGLTPIISARHAHAWRGLAANEANERAALRQGRLPLSPARHLYLETIAADENAGITCTARRFFTLTRFDEPMTLQSPEHRNYVYYVGREDRTGFSPEPLSECDYLITTPALTETERGALLVNHFAGNRPTEVRIRVGDFLLVGVQRSR